MAQITIDLGNVLGPQGVQGVQGPQGPAGASTPIATQITELSTDSEAASAKAVYDLIIGALEGDY